MTHTSKICLGVIGAPHGVRGDIKLTSYTEDPEGIFAYNPLTDEAGKRQFVLSLVGYSGAQLRVRIDGFADRTAVEALRGVRLFVDRARLPPLPDGQYYQADLMGLAVTSETGDALGVVHALHNYGAGDLLEIGPSASDTFFLSMTPDTLISVDLAARHLVVALPVEVDIEADPV
jgi:16S rRNA processing protein RimM